MKNLLNLCYLFSNSLSFIIYFPYREFMSSEVHLESANEFRFRMHEISQFFLFFWAKVFCVSVFIMVGRQCDAHCCGIVQRRL